MPRPPEEADDVQPPPTKLRAARSARALKIGGVALSTFGTIGGIVGVIQHDFFESLLGFADVILGGIFYLHTKAQR